MHAHRRCVAVCRARAGVVTRRRFTGAACMPASTRCATAAVVATATGTPPHASRRGVMAAVLAAAVAGAAWHGSASHCEPNGGSTGTTTDVAVAPVTAAGGEDPVAKHHTDAHAVSNWSGTHVAHPRAILYPESEEEAAAAVADAARTRRRLRVMGNGLSPNGIAFADGTLLSLSLCRRVLAVDTHRRTVTVEAGIAMGELAEALLPFGLTLPNFASIAEQSVAGFTQVGAHGSGATLAPLDHYVVDVTLATPGEGVVTLNADTHPWLFPLARTALGTMGVVTRLTLQCVPAYKVRKRVFTLTRDQVAARHATLLRSNLHVVYMWLPYADTVVVTTNNPVPRDTPCRGNDAPAAGAGDPSAAMRDLYLRTLAARGSGGGGGGGDADGGTAGMSFTQLRDAVLAADPVNTRHVAAVNAAEAAFWRQQAGGAVDWSHRALLFDCGGAQLVSEVAMDAGSLQQPSGAGVAYVRRVLEAVEQAGIPAPCPIEQRWTAGSASPLSPSHGMQLASWVGVIMYLPPEGDANRPAVTAAFRDYRRLCQRVAWDSFGAQEHWAKIEVPGRDAPDDVALPWFCARLAAKYPLADVAAARRRLDPHNLLSNDVVDTLLGRPDAGDTAT